MKPAALFAMAMLVLVTACAGSRIAPAPIETGRVVTPLMEGWRFLDGPAGESAAAPALDDSGWQRVSLPHTWNALGEYALERTAKTRNRQGQGWYRLTLDGASLPRRSRHYLQFDAVGNVADVWVNGVHIGQHAGAFSRFRFDVTDALRRDGPNLIAVRADNSKPEPGSPTEHVIPLQGDFFIHGGMYRPVSLVSVGDAHIALLDHGSTGVFIDTTMANEEALVHVRVKLRTAGGEGALALRTRVSGSVGEATTLQETAVPAGAAEVTPMLTIAKPRLWEGRRDPYLYTATVELTENGRVVDRVVERFGVRSVNFNADHGFFLNSRHLPLRGVSRHQDYLDRGWALTRADHARDMALIAEMGANTVRMAHYQHAEDWFDLADEAGMAVWAELPFVNKVSFSDAPASPELVANARQQMTELIRQNYNHPSVVTWGIGNEVDIDLAFGRLGPRADARPLLDALHALVKQEDPSRPTVIADCCEATPGKKASYLVPLSNHADLMGYNRYFGWYYGSVDDLGPHMDMLHARQPLQPISVSEYGAGGALRQHSDNPEGGPINAGGRPHPEEFQSWFHERSWPQIAARPFIWASWIWNMFDFSSTVRKEGDATDINDKGLVSFDRKVKKDAFYYYQAQWRDDIPVVHIAGRRYVDRAYPVTDVRIYSNAPEVRLALNGRDLGMAPCPGRVCVFRQVKLAPGANRLTAIAGSASDTLNWNAPDAARGLTINAGDLLGFVRDDGSRVGSDNWFEGGEAHRIGGKEAEQLTGADRRLLTGMREGSFDYAIPLPDGRWRVTLTSVETREPRAMRRFDVRANGKTMLRGFSPEQAGGGRYHAAIAAFDVDVTGGILRLGFGPGATLSAIEIRPSAAPASRP